MVLLVVLIVLSVSLRSWHIFLDLVCLVYIYRVVFGFLCVAVSRSCVFMMYHRWVTPSYTLCMFRSGHVPCRHRSVLLLFIARCISRLSTLLYVELHSGQNCLYLRKVTCFLGWFYAISCISCCFVFLLHIVLFACILFRILFYISYYLCVFCTPTSCDFGLFLWIVAQPPSRIIPFCSISFLVSPCGD